MKLKNVPVQFKAGPDDGLEEGEFIVYPSTFTREPDSYGDVVAKGAFLDSIERWKQSGNVLPGLYGHRMDDPDFFVAEAIEMSEDDHGWRIKGRFDLESPKGPQVYRLVKGKRLNQLSFAYDVLDEGGIELEDGVKANELRKLEVHEFSFVPVGANQDTSVVAVKAMTDQLTAELKAGRELSAKNVGTLKDVAASLIESSTAITELLARNSSEQDDEPKAIEPDATKDESASAKSESALVTSPVSDLSAIEALELDVSLSV